MLPSLTVQHLLDCKVRNLKHFSEFGQLETIAPKHPYFPDFCIRQFGRRPANPTRGSTTFNHFSGILSVSTAKEVSRVKAGRVVTTVSDQFIYSDTAYENRICQPVNRHISALVFDVAVPCRNPGIRPHQTFVAMVRFDGLNEKLKAGLHRWPSTGLLERIGVSLFVPVPL